jgi:hypothetical protein
MFYDQSEPDFPTWWDAIEEGKDTASESESPEETGGDGAPDAAELEQEESGARLASGEILSPRFSEEDEDGQANRVEEHDVTEYRSPAVYDRDLVFRVWEFAVAVPGNDADLWRKDEMGNWIYRLDYGRRESEFGWEIFDPGVGRHSQGVYALRPLQWESYVRKFEAIG